MAGFYRTAVIDGVLGHSPAEHGHRVLRVQGKGARVVLVPLPSAVGRAIDCAIDGRSEGPVLLKRRGARMDRHAATRRLRSLAGTAGVRIGRTHPHMLRHKFMTTMLAVGPDLQDVQIAAHPNYILSAPHGLRHLADSPARQTTPPLPIASDAYTMGCMEGLYTVEVEPEVRSWLERLSDRDFGRADFLVGLLAEHADTLGEPYTRHLGGKVRELRFHLLAQQPRITYWLAPGRRIILLTAFRKTRNAETAEVARALQAQKTCEAEHGPAHDTFDREAS